VAKFVKTPFTIEVFDLMHRPGEQRERELDIAAPEKLGEGIIAVPAGDNIHIDLRLESLGDGILVSAEIETTAIGECGRCLEPIEQDLEVEFQELFAYSVDEAFDYEVHDDHVDLEPLVREAVVLALPFQPVCRPDCAGLDPETGEKLAEPLDSALEETIDPRWAALSQLAASTDNGDTSTGKKK
jgi:uncharacterized protein